MRRVTLIQKPDHVLREHTSANQIQDYIDCPRMWGFRNLLGIKEDKKSPWLQLGSELHWQLRCYVRGYQLDTETEAGKRALAGLHLIPDPKTVDVVEDEAEVKINSVLLLPGTEPIQVQGARDLTLAFGSDQMLWEGTPENGHYVPTKELAWTLWDYKTTRGDTRGNPKLGIKPDPWAYVMTPSQLSSNVAGNLYAWDIMSNRHVNLVPARWVYFLTDLERHPDAKATDHAFTRQEVEERARLLLSLGLEHRELVRRFRFQSFDVNTLPAKTSRCPKFGGCPYRAETGGPCTVIRTLGEMMTQQMPPNGQSEIERMLAERRAAGVPNGQAAPPMPAGYGAPPGGPPPMMQQPPPLPPGGAPMAQAPGMPGLPAPSLAGTGAPGQPFWNGQQWIYPQQAPAPAAPPIYPPTPPAPHLPPEAYVQPPPAQPGFPASQMPPQQMPLPQAYSPVAAPQLPAAAPAEPKKRGRKPNRAPELGAIAGASTPDEDEVLPEDQRARFMRTCCQIIAGNVDLVGKDNQTIQALARDTVAYAEAVWNWLQAAKA